MGSLDLPAAARAIRHESATDGAQAIRRAIEVVRLVAQMQRSGANLSRVARAAGLSTSTAFRILRTLTEERILSHEPTERNYYLGPLAFELGLASSLHSQVDERWRAAVEQIARTTRHTAYLMARSENDAVCRLCAQGSMAIRAMPMEVGQRLPLGVGAGSLAILASLPDDEVDRILFVQASRLESYPGGKARAERIRERVKLTRSQGYSISSGVVATGVIGVGVAIFPSRGLNQFALSVSAVASIIDKAELERMVSAMNHVISPPDQ